MANRAAKAALFDSLASVARALGSGRRAELVDVLAQGERSVDELAREISQSVAKISQHLQVLAGAGLVRSRREGTRIVYRLASERVAELWAAVRDVAAQHVPEVTVLADEYLGERCGVEPVSAAELEERLARGDVVLLDVRPEREFRAGHIAGARSAPLPALADVAATLPKRREIVAYCRGGLPPRRDARSSRPAGERGDFTLLVGLNALVGAMGGSSGACCPWSAATSSASARAPRSSPSSSHSVPPRR